MGLAPLAVLPSVAGDQRADMFEVRDEAFDLMMLRQEKREWGERKLFEVTSTVEALTFGQLLPLVTFASTMPPIPKPIEDMCRVIRASTKTPDIESDATIEVFDTSGQRWCDLKEDVSRVFRVGPHKIASAVLCGVREHLPPGVDLWGVVGGLVVPVASHEQINEVLGRLGSIRVQFAYYGPPPYPNDGRLRRFNLETEAWEPVVRGGQS